MTCFYLSSLYKIPSKSPEDRVVYITNWIFCGLVHLPRGGCIVLPKRCQPRLEALLDYYTKQHLNVFDDIQWVDWAEWSRVVSDGLHEMALIKKVPLMLTQSQQGMSNPVLTLDELDNKCSFTRFAQRLGFQTPYTLFSVDDYQSDRNCLELPLVIKMPYAVCSMGVRIVRCRSDLQAAVNTVFADGGMIQSYLAHQSIVTVVGMIDSREVCRILGSIRVTVKGGTDTIDSKYNDSVAEPCAISTSLSHKVDAMMQLMRASGMQGVFSLDFVEHGDELYILECNPRHGGVSHGVTIADRYGFTNWSMHCLCVGNAELPIQSLVDLFYQPAMQSGLIIISVPIIGSDRFRFLLIGSQQERTQMFAMIKDRLL